MKQLFLLTILLLATVTATAQNIVTIPIVCFNQADLKKTINKYEEKLFLTFKSDRILSNGSVVESDGYFYVNPKTQTWTIVEQYTDDIFCVVGVGSKIQPGTGKQVFYH